jgi:hypothetical protein
MRDEQRTQGRVALTAMELRKRNLPAVTVGFGTSGRIVQTFNFGSLDYVSDAGMYKITVSHNLGIDAYFWSVVSRDTNEPLNMTVEKARQDNYDLTLWFSFNDKNIKVAVF